MIDQISLSCALIVVKWIYIVLCTDCHRFNGSTTFWIVFLKKALLCATIALTIFLGRVFAFASSWSAAILDTFMKSKIKAELLFWRRNIEESASRGAYLPTRTFTLPLHVRREKLTLVAHTLWYSALSQGLCIVLQVKFTAWGFASALCFAYNPT